MGTWMKGVKRHKLPGINSRDVNMCSIIKTTNTTVCVTWESGQERKPEEFSFQGKKYIYFCFFHVVSIWDEGVFTKFTHSTMSVASQWSCYLDNKTQTLLKLSVWSVPLPFCCQTRQRLPAPGPLDLLFRLRTFFPQISTVLFPLLPWGLYFSITFSGGFLWSC